MAAGVGCALASLRNIIALWHRSMMLVVIFVVIHLLFLPMNGGYFSMTGAFFWLIPRQLSLPLAPFYCKALTISGAGLFLQRGLGWLMRCRWAVYSAACLISVTLSVLLLSFVRTEAIKNLIAFKLFIYGALRGESHALSIISRSCCAFSE